MNNMVLELIDNSISDYFDGKLENIKKLISSELASNDDKLLTEVIIQYLEITTGIYKRDLKTLLEHSDKVITEELERRGI